MIIDLVDSDSKFAQSLAWSCEFCTFENLEWKDVCEMCEKERFVPRQDTETSLDKQQEQVDETNKSKSVTSPAKKKRKVAPIQKSKITAFFRGTGSSSSSYSSNNSGTSPPSKKYDVVESSSAVVRVDSSTASSPVVARAESSDEDKKSMDIDVEITTTEDKELEEDLEQPEVDLASATMKSLEIPLYTANDIEYSLVAHALELVTGTTKRLKKHEYLVNAFRCALTWCKDVVAIYKLVFLMIGKIANDHDYKSEFSIDRGSLTGAMKKFGIDPKQVSKLYRTEGEGDLGDAIYKSRTTQKTLGAFMQKKTKAKHLTVSLLFDTLQRIASEKGTGSRERKTQHVTSLMSKCRGQEIRFLVRILIHNTRIGASEVSMLDAFVHAYLWTYKTDLLEKKDEVFQHCRARYFERPDIPWFVGALLNDGELLTMQVASMQHGIPVRPMLANASTSVEDFNEAFDGKGSYLCEFKYDGQRIQIHSWGEKEIALFSRNCQLMTSKYPEVPGIINSARNANVKSFIMDAEIVAVNRSEGKILPFQVLSTRKREVGGDGADVQSSSSKEEVEVALYAFDLMELNGESLLMKPLSERRQLIETLFQAEPYKFQLTESKQFEHGVTLDNEEEKSRQKEEIMKFMQSALDARCEGVMAKLLDSTYVPNKRSTTWMKMKQDYMSDLSELSGGGIGDSLDLVVIGAWRGSGRKSAWWSPFLLACYDPQYDCFKTVCKVMSGFSDAFYKQQNEIFREIQREDDDEEGESENMEDNKPNNYISKLDAPAWFKPIQVWEIRGAELTISPTHTAGSEFMEDENQGLGLRFPRFIKVREDKTYQDATTSQQIYELYQRQTRSRLSLPMKDE